MTRSKYCALLLALSAAHAAPDLDSALFERLEWRGIGPAIMGGRITDIEGIPGNPNVVYVASASGGLWKTTNAGTTWTPIFDQQSTISIGDIAVDPRNPDVVWVGTGEANARNSVSFGDGVYKSLDGGKTWRNLGLHDTRHISRIVINPLNTSMVYVAALGHNTGPDEERGVFMTTDGGETWHKTLYLDAEHGAADLDIDPSNPNLLYATMWRFDRKPWTFISGSEKGGVFRSLDAGRTWKKVEKGLPKLFGRAGVRVAPGKPNVVYVIGESKEGTLYRSDDHGENFRLISKEAKVVGRGLYYSHLQVDPREENRLYAIAMGLYTSIDGGRTFRRISSRTHGDYHTLWIDPTNPNRIWQGQDGGIAVSWDRGENWEFVGNIPLGQFYQVSADNRWPFYYVFGGLQDNGTYTGPSRVRQPAGILNDVWQMVSFGDGFHAINHPDHPDLYLSESQGGGIVRTDMRTWEQQDVSPQPRRNDGGPVSELKYRFNWNTPIVASPHDKNTVYFGGNVIFKSTDFGKTWQPISPDLTTNDPEKIKSVGTVWTENTTAEYHCTVIRIAESPVKAGMIWAGTDDGNLQLTTDGGKNWTNLIQNVLGVPRFAQVASIEPSRTAAGAAYAAFEHHMFDDLRPYVFKTTDSGKTWTNISGDLPSNAYVWVAREDPKNPKLLYAGTELGLFASYTGGSHWIRLHLKNLPPVAVRDLLVHPRENDLILGTHGRGIWILDDATPIQQLNAEALNQDAVLFDMRPAMRFNSRFTRYGIGNKPFAGPNPAYGAPITYYLKDKPESLKIQILDSGGKVIRDLKEPAKEKGLNSLAWDLRYEPPKQRRPPSEEEREAEEFRGGGPRGPQVLPGRYTVELVAGGKSLRKDLEVRADPTVDVSASDLRAQFDYALKLRDLQSSTNEALRSIDAIQDQIRQAEKSLKALLTEPSKELSHALSERLKQLASIESRLARPRNIPGYSIGPKLIDRLGALASNIDRVLAAPTPYQREHFRELEAEFQRDIGEVNTIVTRAIPELNDLLRKQNAPTVMPGKPIEMPAR
jgi:photosystem II stability/assembly factor-like uncharacterized protein